MRHVIALDVGGTGMKAALVGADGTLLYEARRPTGRERGPDAIVESILDFAAELRAHGAERFGEPAAAAGVAVPGIVDAERGHRRVRREPRLARRSAARPAVRTARRRPRRARATTYAPAASPRAGSARAGAPTGSSSSRSAPASPAPSASAAASRPARTAARARSATSSYGPAARECGCGQRGCLETLASAAAVEPGLGRGVRRPAGRRRGRRQGRGSGDPRARAVWQDAVDALADGLVTGLTLLDPRTLIIGGGLAEAGDTLFGPLRDAVAASASPSSGCPAIVPAALGDAAGCLGAGLLAWDLLSTEVPPDGTARIRRPTA